MRPREVRIVESTFGKSTKAFFVNYVTRNKHQRYHAAQFDANFSTMDDVKKWVNSQPHLTLVEDK